MLNSHDPAARVWLAHLATMCYSHNGCAAECFEAGIGNGVAQYCLARPQAYSALLSFADSDECTIADRNAIEWMHLNTSALAAISKKTAAYPSTTAQ